MMPCCVLTWLFILSYTLLALYEQFHGSILSPTLEKCFQSGEYKIVSRCDLNLPFPHI